MRTTSPNCTSSDLSDFRPDRLNWLRVASCLIRCSNPLKDIVLPRESLAALVDSRASTLAESCERQSDVWEVTTITKAWGPNLHLHSVHCAASQQLDKPGMDKCSVSDE